MIRFSHPNFHDTAGGKAARFWFLALLVMAISCFWITPRLPMVDLPQHAAQIAGLRDMLTGQFNWNDMVWVDLTTSYLVGYLPATLLALLLPVHAAIAIVLTAAFCAYVWLALIFRRRMKAPAALDPLLLLSFFGNAFQWGNFNFLVALPVCLLFLLTAIDYAQKPGRKTVAHLLAMGTLLYLSHILMFLFGCVLGGLILLAHERRIGRLIRLSLPFVFFLGLVVVYLALNTGHVSAGSGTTFYPWLAKFFLFGIFPFDGDLREPFWPWFLLPFLAPFLAGFRPRLQLNLHLVPLGGLLLIWFLVPSTVYGTHGIFERFAVFTMLFYTAIFAAPKRGISPAEARIGFIFTLLTCASYFTVLNTRIYETRAENQSFEEVLAVLEPGQRLLNLTVTQESPAMHQTQTYLNWALWYQAEKRGWVDFNFASYHPQIIKFQPKSRPPVNEDMYFHASIFNWKMLKGDRYRYILVRAVEGVPATLLQQITGNGECRVSQTFAHAPYYLFTNEGCP